MLMHQLLTRGANRVPDKTAFHWTDRGRRLTYAQAVVAMEAAAGLLHHLGVRKGDRVSIVAHNGLDYLVAMFGCWRVGAIAALVNVKLADDLDYYFGDHDPTLVIYTHDLHAQIVAAAKKRPQIKHLVCMDGPQDGALSWPDLIDAGFSPPLDPSDEAAIAHLSYTSGSTGQPKGACLAHEPTMRATSCIAERLRITSSDISFGPTALSSSYQLVANLLPPLHRLASVHVMGRWSAEAGLAAMNEAGASILVGNPILLADVLSAVRDGIGKGLKVSPSLRVCVSGGAPVPAALKQAFRDELKLPLAESYGQSEIGGFVALGAPDLPPDHQLGSIGLPLPDKDIRIFDEHGRECATDQVGEVCLRGGTMVGYWNRPGKTNEALRDGWLHTGDAGSIDRDGYVTMRGRFSELLTVNGQTWFPRDIEEMLLKHNAVCDAAVVGTPDGRHGHVPHVFLTLNKSSEAADIINDANMNSAYDLKLLKAVILPSLPMTPTGKIDKMRLITLANLALSKASD